ncbi:hypothetical protein IGI04_031589 [Brassica rapa subsp. trilocularis]|uniref:Uncharacterized protein n=1 Tax=Brassica rapa subsp. trilocularis TaxID=1813537 RepID=A0ABQ7LU01_BRACM|nr:hypothetical protein IGI04_031589 [Brassica rapa subsp. trilocularis]
MKGWTSVYELVDRHRCLKPTSLCTFPTVFSRVLIFHLVMEHKFVNMFVDSDANLSSYFTNAGSLIPPLTQLQPSLNTPLPPSYIFYPLTEMFCNNI